MMIAMFSELFCVSRGCVISLTIENTLITSQNNSETPKQYLPKASSSKSNKRRAPSTPPSRRVSSSQVKKEKEEKKAESEYLYCFLRTNTNIKPQEYPEICIICGTTETSTWRFVSDPSSSSGRARACNCKLMSLRKTLSNYGLQLVVFIGKRTTVCVQKHSGRMVRKTERRLRKPPQKAGAER